LVSTAFVLILSSASTRYIMNHNNSCIKTLHVVKSLQDKIAEMKTHYLFSAHQQNSDTIGHYLVKCHRILENHPYGRILHIK